MRERPLTARQERFCLLIVKGLTGTEAYKRAGYQVASAKAAEVSASRLLSNVKVVSRVAALQDQNAKKVGVSVESETARLMEIEQLAAKDGQYSAAISAHALLARLHGLITDHKTVDIVHHKPARNAIVKDLELTEDDWVRLYKPQE